MCSACFPTSLLLEFVALLDVAPSTHKGVVVSTVLSPPVADEPLVETTCAAIPDEDGIDDFKNPIGECFYDIGSFHCFWCTNQLYSVWCGVEGVVEGAVECGEWRVEWSGACNGEGAWSIGEVLRNTPGWRVKTNPV